VVLGFLIPVTQCSRAYPILYNASTNSFSEGAPAPVCHKISTNWRIGYPAYVYEKSSGDALAVSWLWPPFLLNVVLWHGTALVILVVLMRQVNTRRRREKTKVI
jgi:hypothetical protein